MLDSVPMAVTIHEIEREEGRGSWNENRVAGVAMLAIETQTEALCSVNFYGDERERVERFVQGFELVRESQAWAIFIPPLASDESMRGGDPLHYATMWSQKRSYLVICPKEGLCELCAPAIIFSEWGEDTNGYLKRMSKMLNERLIIIPQELFLKIITGKVQSEDQYYCLEEFDTLCEVNDGYHRAPFVFTSKLLGRIKEDALSAETYLAVLWNSPIDDNSHKSYKAFWEDLPTRGFDVSWREMVEIWREKEAEASEPLTFWGGRMALIGPYDSEVLLDRMVKEGWTFSPDDPNRATSPEGEVEYLPLYLMAAVEKRFSGSS